MKKIEEVKDTFLKDIKKYIFFLEKNRNTSNVINYIGYYSFIARCEILLQKQIKAKQAYYKASRCALLYVKLEQDCYPQYQWKKQQSTNFVATFYESLIPHLLCDNIGDLKTLANIIKVLEQDTSLHNNDIAMIHALKYLLLDDKPKAIIQYNSKFQDIQPYLRGLALTLAGILHDEIDLINKGIQYEIFYYKKTRTKDSIFYFMSEKATAWVKLAQVFGFEPDINNDLIQKDLLKKEDTIVYEDIIELYQALELEGYKNVPTLKNIIKSWFDNH